MTIATLAQDALQAGMPLGELYHYLFVAAVLFGLGVIGFLARRNLIIMFLCTEMMFQAAGITLIAFSKYHFNPDGEVFVIFVLTIAAAEAALAQGDARRVCLGHAQGLATPVAGGSDRHHPSPNRRHDLRKCSPCRSSPRI